MADKKAPSGRSRGDAFLFAWVSQPPGIGQPPQLERVEILSERNPTRMFKRAGSAEPSPRLILVMSATGRDYQTARAKLIRRIRRTPALIWMGPWLDHWEQGSQDHRPPPSKSPPMSLTKAMAQAD